MVKLPWIPSEAEWLRLLGVVAEEPIRNRVMLALAYDAALRREELCALRSDDLDPAHRTLRVRAETTKTRRERVVPYSAPTGVLLSEYLQHRATLSRARGGLFLSESRRNHAEPLTLWTWSKVVRRVALAANLPRFSTHTTRHLCLTDLARMGWELHAIATFAGHRSTDSTLQYIHLSGRDLSAKLNSSMGRSTPGGSACSPVPALGRTLRHDRRRIGVAGRDGPRPAVWAFSLQTAAGTAGSRCSTAKPRRCSRSVQSGCGATGPWASHDEPRCTGVR